MCSCWAGRRTVEGKRLGIPESGIEELLRAYFREIVMVSNRMETGR